MKCLKDLHFVLLFFFCLSGFTKIAAQAKLPLSPSNLNGMMEHLDYRYAEIIQSDLNIVRNKLLSEFAGSFEPELNAPQPNIRYMNKTSTSFFWPSDPNVHHINLFYFNLTTGQTSIVEEIGVDSIVLNFLEKDPFLFAFQSIGYSGEKGKMTLMMADHSFDFIIVDKDVLRSDIPGSYMVCGCSSGVVTGHNVHRDLFNSIYIPWTAQCVSTKYNLDIQVNTTWEDTISVSLDFVHDPESYSNPLVHSLNYCSHPGFNTPYNLGIPDLCETVVTNKGMTLYFDPEYVETVSFTPTICDCASNKDNDDGTGTGHIALREKVFPEITLQNVPNPVDQYTNINYTIPQSGTLSIVLYNSFGQAVQYLKQNEFHKKGDYQQMLDTKDLVAGVYTCVLKLDGQIKTTRLLKL